MYGAGCHLCDLLSYNASHGCHGQYDSVIPRYEGWNDAARYISILLMRTEFVVNKLMDRGSLSATTIVTNVQDFITIIAKGLGVMK